MTKAGAGRLVPRVLGIACLLLAAARTAGAQPEECKAALIRARELFDLGRFDQVAVGAGPCDVRGVPLSDQVAWFELKAKAALAQDDVPAAQAAIRVLVRRDPDFVPDDPPLFVEMVASRKASLVLSVSKMLEDWREAPATIVVLTAEQIRQRGYRDLERLLHDLPGFDIARGNGDSYANIYQRGYRSGATDRTLLLVDGVEQNDLHSNVAYLSRQYPLSNVARVEVIYGPASTMYGPNAFSGVINVITAEPATLIAKNCASAGFLSCFGLNVSGGGGAFGTAWLDTTMAGRSSVSDSSWSLTARMYRSDEPDLSAHDNWRFGLPDALDEWDYRQTMLLEGKTLDKYLCRDAAPSEETGTLFAHPERCANPNAEVIARLSRALREGLVEARDQNGDGTVDLVLTDSGVARARRLDRALWDTGLVRPDARFSDPTRDWFLGGKLKFGDFTVGVQTWEQQEGTAPWYGDWARTEGGVWVPNQLTLYSRYARPLGRALSLNLLLQYKDSQISRRSVVPLLATYANATLDVLSLLDERPAQVRRYHLSQDSSQFRTELTGVYQGAENINAIVGIDVRDNSVQADYLVEGDEPLFGFEPTLTPNSVRSTDIGFFGQGSCLWRDTLRLVAGGRYDLNHVRAGSRVSLRTFENRTPTVTQVADVGGFFSPRVALVARFGSHNKRHLRSVPGDLIAKVMFAKASQQPSNFQRFASEPLIREFPSPFLQREDTQNLEMSVAWEPNDGTRLEATVYSAEFGDVLHTAIKVDPCCLPAQSGRIETIGGFHVWGSEVIASTRIKSSDLFANYSYTRPMNSDRPQDQFGETLAFRGVAIDRLPIGDIARHKLTAGAYTRFGSRLGLSLTLNAVGRRPTGPATTSRLNPESVPGYAILNAALTYDDERRGLTLQAGVDNLFDTLYYDPGVRSAGLYGFVGRIPQPGFAAYARLSYRFNAPDLAAAGGRRTR